MSLPKGAKIWRPRYIKRRTKQRKDGKYAWSFGARIGYWPCMRAPNMRIDFSIWQIYVWCGWHECMGPEEK